jgi:hypothetical protein
LEYDGGQQCLVFSHVIVKKNYFELINPYSAGQIYLYKKVAKAGTTTELTAKGKFKALLVPDSAKDNTANISDSAFRKSEPKQTFHSN